MCCGEAAKHPCPFAVCPKDSGKGIWPTLLILTVVAQGPVF
jgi:hypothetical protein